MINMNKLYKNNQAISVIIGALMITLIVVTAATSFALFVSENQKKIQEAERLDLMRELEDVDIQNVRLKYDDNERVEKKCLEEINFKICNAHQDETKVVDVKINNVFIERFNVSYEDIKSRVEWVFDEDEGDYIKNNGQQIKGLTFRPMERVTFYIDEGINDIKTNIPVIIEIETKLLNNFKKSIKPLPLTPRIDLEYIQNETGHIKEYIYFDGEAETSEEDDNFITQWDWNVHYQPEPYLFQPEITEIPPKPGQGGVTPSIYFISDWKVDLSNEMFTCDPSFPINNGYFKSDVDKDGLIAHPKEHANNYGQYYEQKGGLFAQSFNGEFFTFIDNNSDWKYTPDLIEIKDIILNKDPDQNGMEMKYPSVCQGGLITSYGAYIIDHDSMKKYPFVFIDNNGNGKYNNATDEIIIYNPLGDGNIIDLLPTGYSINDLYEGEQGYLFAFDYSIEDIQFRGQRVKAEFSPYHPNMLHTVTLIVTDNYGMISYSSIEYRH